MKYNLFYDIRNVSQKCRNVSQKNKLAEMSVKNDASGGVDD